MTQPGGTDDPGGAALTQYPYYHPSEPDEIRAQIAKMTEFSSWAGRTHDVVEQYEKQTRASVEGDLLQPLEDRWPPLSRQMRASQQASLWAAGQMETWADAVETYNRDSTDPMSIMRLNALVNQAQTRSVYWGRLYDPRTLGDPSPGDPGYSYGQDYSSVDQQALNALNSRYQHYLDREHARLRQNFDDAALEVAHALKAGPTPAQVRQLWRAGNLPPWAAVVWPELELASLPVRGVRPSIVHGTATDFFELLASPDSALTPQELEYARFVYAEDMATFNEDWSPATAPRLAQGETPAGYDGNDAALGWIQGPDGAWYPIVKPSRGEPSPTGTSAGPSNTTLLYSDVGDWTTLDHRVQQLQTDTETWHMPDWFWPAYGLLGGTIPDPKAVPDGEDYLTWNLEGELLENRSPGEQPQSPDRPRGLGPQSPAWVPHKSDSVVDPWTSEPLTTPRTPTRANAAAAVDLAINAMRGVLLTDQLDATHTYGSNITFQTNPDGQTRAVIQMAQYQYDSNGDPHLEQFYGGIDEDGSFQTTTWIESSD